MHQNMKEIAQSNREAWNEALIYHQKARKNYLTDGFMNPNFTALDRDCDDELISKLNDINLSGKTIAQLPCNNGRELLSLMKFGADRAVGFDISDVAIEEARNLSKISKLNVTFERTDILEIGNEYDGMFDFIYVSEGSLQWFPDLNEYFGIISRLLKEKGKILIFEMHPFAYFFEQRNDADEHVKINDLVPYFKKGPYGYAQDLDYVGETQYAAKPCYWFMHTLSDIFNAIIKNGIEILEFNEYNIEMGNNPATKFLGNFPLSYMLTGKKK